MSPDRSSADRDFVARALRVGITVGAVLAALLLVLWLLKGALTPLAVAWVIAYLLDPVIDRFEARGVPRPAAIVLLLGLSGGVLFATAFFGVPWLQHEIASVSERLPGYVEDVLQDVVRLLREHLGLELPASVQEGIAALRGGALGLPVDAAQALLARALGAVTGTLGALVSIVIIPVLAFYLLVEFDRLRHAILDLVPRAYQGAVAAHSSRVDRLVSSFIRGQLTVCGTLALLYAIGFSVIGIDLAVPIALAAGLLAIVPYVGGATALAAASTMCMLQFGVDVHLALVVGWYAIVQGLDATVLTPRIVGGSLGMHPVGVIVALMIGADLLGFLGLLIAVPVAAVVQVFAQDGVSAWRASGLYTGTGNGSAEV